MTITNNDLILRHLDLARKIACSKKRQISSIHYEEIEAAAYYGLVDAANKYDPKQCDNFEIYAGFRINGAICDYLRELRWGTRTKTVKTTEISEDQTASCETVIGNEGFFDKLTSELSWSAREMMNKYYLGEQKMAKIASDMGVNESRVSQVLSESRSKLKKTWHGLECELWAEVA